MTPHELSRQEEHLFAVLSGERFLKMEGLSNEVPFFIYPYEPEHALDVAKAKKRVRSRRSSSPPPATRSGKTIPSSWPALNPQQHLAPAIRARLADGDFDIVFLTGIGEVFPYIRSHNVLNNLQSVVVGRPMLMFFPGRYEQSDTLGSSLVLFGRLKDDQYYRAKNILEQEP